MALLRIKWCTVCKAFKSFKHMVGGDWVCTGCGNNIWIEPKER